MVETVRVGGGRSSIRRAELLLMQTPTKTPRRRTGFNMSLQLHIYSDFLLISCADLGIIAKVGAPSSLSSSAVCDCLSLTFQQDISK